MAACSDQQHVKNSQNVNQKKQQVQCIATWGRRRRASSSALSHTKFEVGQPVHSWLVMFLLSVNIDPLTLNVYNVSAAAWSNSVLNFSEIKQAAAELIAN